MTENTKRSGMEKRSRPYPAYVRKIIHDLTDQNPSARMSALQLLGSCLRKHLDITPAVPVIEQALYDELTDIRREAAAVLREYVLLTYHLDISSSWAAIKYFLLAATARTDFCPSRNVLSLLPVPVESHCRKHRPLRERIKAIRLPQGSGTSSMPLIYTPAGRQIGYSCSSHGIIPATPRIFPLQKMIQSETALQLFSQEAFSGGCDWVTSDMKQGHNRVIMLPFERSVDVKITPFYPRLPLDCSGPVSAYPLAMPSFHSPEMTCLVPYLSAHRIAELLQTDMSEPPVSSSGSTNTTGAWSSLYPFVRKSPQSLIAVWSIILFVLSIIFSTNETSVSSTTMRLVRELSNPAAFSAKLNIPDATVPGATGIRGKVLHDELEDAGMVRPEYLATVKRGQRRFIATESAVFRVLEDEERSNAYFNSWFNELNDIQKRGFILFVRSKALTRLLGDTISFSKDQWEAGKSDSIRRLTKRYLEENSLLRTVQAYESIYRTAEKKATLFLDTADWLETFLGENYADFTEGLFYFFSEHKMSLKDVRRKASKFSQYRTRIEQVSNAIIAYRGKNVRISPKRYVSDAQIREIVAAAFFAEIFYGVPADFITLISAYETNFSMKFWKGGQGTTQQTIRSANTVLQSEYWIKKLNETAGVTFTMQLVPISALDNVFLCVTEAAKTVAIKAAEIQIKTEDISSQKKVRLAGTSRSAAYATAYKYNGSEVYALNYAQEIHEYYANRSHWLKAFSDGAYKLLSYNK